MFGDDAPLAATALASVKARRTPQSTNPDAVTAAWPMPRLDSVHRVSSPAGPWFFRIWDLGFRVWDLEFPLSLLDFPDTCTSPLAVIASVGWFSALRQGLRRTRFSHPA